jgi:hypothetical protein
MDAKNRVVKDTIEINGRKFILKRYDPLSGTYILSTAIKFIMPFGIGSALSKQMGVGELGTSGTEMTKQQFIDFQKDILASCYELLPAGEAKVVNDNGTYGIDNFTMQISIQLIIASMAFNFIDFFDESLLESIKILTSHQAS